MVRKGYICRAAMLAQGKAARSSTASLWLSVTIITGWPSSLGHRSMERMSPLAGLCRVAVAQIAYSDFREELSTLRGTVGLARLLLAVAAGDPGVEGCAPELLRVPTGVRQRSGDDPAVPAVLGEAAVVAVLLASAGHARIAAKPHVMLQRTLQAYILSTFCFSFFILQRLVVCAWS